MVANSDDAARPRLIVVSNRLPYNLPRKKGGKPPKRNVGGLVNALEPVLAAEHAWWIGWDGIPLPSAAAVQAALARPHAGPLAGIELRGVPLSEREVALYYHGYANRALWPLLHDFPGKATYVPEHYAAYRRVNERFARIAVAAARDGGRLWIHDFHLMLVPQLARSLGFTGRIDFFLHTPFPAQEIFRTLPQRSEILASLVTADTVAFQVPLYRDNFIDAARLILGARSRSWGAVAAPVLLEHDAGETTALAIPIGIDVESFERVARSPSVVNRARRIREAHAGRRILFAADRLDYTKGIGERLHVLERFLTDNPQAAGRVVLIVVVVPSRHQVKEYRAVKREIDREVGRINGEHGRDGWVPIHYSYRALERADLVAHYLAADVALVTPLRDGMNLVAAEYVASRVDEDGVLVISEFAGIAERSPGALLVNPYDVEGSARTIATALALDREERRHRMRQLRERVRANPASRWARRCLDDAPLTGRAPPATKAAGPLSAGPEA